MELDWAAVVTRYPAGSTIPPLSGSSTLTVVSVDDERICLKQRLWQDCVTRRDLDSAVALLGERAGSCDAIAFSQELRTRLATGPDARTECSRVPNLTAIVLRALGFLRG